MEDVYKSRKCHTSEIRQHACKLEGGLGGGGRGRGAQIPDYQHNSQPQSAVLVEELDIATDIEMVLVPWWWWWWWWRC